MPQETVLITGASSGIGWELAKLFAADGSRLILVARNEQKLNELAQLLHQQHGTESIVIALDLSVAGAAQELFERVTSQGLQVDVLVNNAGFGQYGRFEDVPLERYTAMCQLNITALMELTYLCLQQMKARQAGRILNIGSTASFQPGPHAAVYYATKAFVLSFSEALTAELWGTPIRVSCLCPGPTATGFGKVSEMEKLPFFRLSTMQVEDVARAGHRAVRRGRRLMIPGLINNLLAFSNRITARPVVLWIVKRIQPVRDE